MMAEDVIFLTWKGFYLNQFMLGNLKLYVSRTHHTVKDTRSVTLDGLETSRPKLVPSTVADAHVVPYG